MKKSASTSLALVALALTAAVGIALLGGPNVFSVLSNIKFPSKPKIEEPPVDEKQDKENVLTELALEAKASETKVEELKPEEPAVQKVQTKKAEEVVKPASKPKPQEEEDQKTEKSTFTAPVIPPNATQKKPLDNGKYTLTFPRGETVEYNEHGIPVWSSWEGRLTETEEEKNWLKGYVSIDSKGSSGSEGKGFWCVTPSGSKNVNKPEECHSFTGWKS